MNIIFCIYNIVYIHDREILKQINNQEEYIKQDMCVSSKGYDDNK